MGCKVDFVSAPAGSGKTERLARAYINLLKEGIEVSRILAITFTEKAAAEMKERILSILSVEEPVLYRNFLAQILLVRISTIDSFCLSLLRRFADVVGLGPDAEILEDDFHLRQEVFYDTLFQMEKEPSLDTLFLKLIEEGKFRGWSKFTRKITYLFDKIYLTSRKMDIPLVEKKENWGEVIRQAEFFRENKRVVFTTNGELRKVPLPEVGMAKEEYQKWLTDIFPLIITAWEQESYLRAKDIHHLFQKEFLQNYRQAKRSRNLLDFRDLGLLAYQLLEENPQALNILYAFDEHTDHIMVDEFQDTNFLQWGIINKLTEEWRSGSSWRDENTRTSLFLVGDEKQAVYYFREANSEVFRKVPRLISASGLEVNRMEVTDNFRSREAIIAFTNYLFGLIFQPEKKEYYRVSYTPFRCCRKSSQTGLVEFILLPPVDGEEDNLMEQRRRHEAITISRRILSLVDKFSVSEKDESLRPCRFKDIGILLRGRTHLSVYEKALEEYRIPYIVVKGTGFYQTEEVFFLSSLVSFLTDTNDDFSLYFLLTGPLFGFMPAEILILNQEGKGSLWDRMQKNPGEKAKRAADLLAGFLNRTGKEPLSLILERFLLAGEGWRLYHLETRGANIKKFLSLIEDWEREGWNLYEIKDRLEKRGKRPEEPKANVSVEGLDAVQILTVHSAKGLEFPIVFLPGLDEELKASKKQGEILAMEIGSDRFRLAYQPDNTLRKYHPLFIADRERQKEEERHLFYVGVTRARDALFLTASETNRKTKESRLSWLLDHIDPDEPPVLPGFTVKREETPEEEVLIAEKEESFKKSPVPLEPCFFQEIPVPEGEFQSVTSSLEKGEGNVSWKFFGEVMHQILDDISRGYMKPFPEEVKKRFLRLAYPLPISGAVSLAEEAVRQMQILLSSPAGEIILPQPDGFSEVPVIFVEGSTHISGRIDRLIIKQDTIFIYDYKTGPIGSTEIVPAVNYYSAQLRTYRKALELIYPGRMVKMFLIFTYTGEVRGC